MKKNLGVNIEKTNWHAFDADFALNKTNSIANGLTNVEAEKTAPLVHRQ